MNITDKEYGKMAKKASPPSPKFVNSIKAFCVGGLICTLSEGLSKLYEYLKLDEDSVRALVPVTVILLTAILTSAGIFDKLARHAGAGTIVPITGFANAVVSPAMEFKTEGHILGTGANMFRIAGPVIVYGSAAGVIYGVIYYLSTR